MYAKEIIAAYVGFACTGAGLAMLLDKNKTEKVVGVGLLAGAAGCAKLMGLPFSVLTAS